MKLPGGLWEHGERLREFAFIPVTGELEMQLAQASEQAETLPEAVTQMLCHAISHIGEAPVTASRVRALCVGDRQYLARELQCHLGTTRFWASERCGACGGTFDYQVDYTQLPVVEARDSYPFVELQDRADTIRLRLPCGEDQERLAELHDVPEAEVMRTLLGWCAMSTLPELADDQLHSIDAAMDAVSPAVVTELSASCSHCGEPLMLPLDPYSALGSGADELLRQVHRIASRYHWSEAQILALPRERRLRYLDLIDRDRGLLH